MRFLKLLLALGLLVALTSTARAATIDYIFSGTGTGTIGGDSFSGDFSVSVVADTANVVTYDPYYHAVTGAGTFTQGINTYTLLDTSGVVANNQTTFPALGFSQTEPAPVYSSDEAVLNAAFVGYDLTTTFAKTAGTVSFEPQTFRLAGDESLVFNSISALSFEADAVSSVPFPSSLPMFVFAIGSLFVLTAFRRRGSN